MNYNEKKLDTHNAVCSYGDERIEIKLIQYLICDIYKYSKYIVRRNKRNKSKCFGFNISKCTTTQTKKTIAQPIVAILCDTSPQSTTFALPTNNSNNINNNKSKLCTNTSSNDTMFMNDIVYQPGSLHCCELQQESIAIIRNKLLQQLKSLRIAKTTSNTTITTATQSGNKNATRVLIGKGWNMHEFNCNENMKNFSFQDAKIKHPIYFHCHLITCYHKSISISTNNTNSCTYNNKDTSSDNNLNDYLITVNNIWIYTSPYYFVRQIFTAFNAISRLEEIVNNYYSNVRAATQLLSKVKASERRLKVLATKSPLHSRKKKNKKATNNNKNNNNNNSLALDNINNCNMIISNNINDIDQIFPTTGSKNNNTVFHNNNINAKKELLSPSSASNLFTFSNTLNNNNYFSNNNDATIAQCYATFIDENVDSNLNKAQQHVGVSGSDTSSCDANCTMLNFPTNASTSFTNTLCNKINNSNSNDYYSPKNTANYFFESNYFNSILENEFTNNYNLCCDDDDSMKISTINGFSLYQINNSYHNNTSCVYPIIYSNIPFTIELFGKNNSNYNSTRTNNSTNNVSDCNDDFMQIDNDNDDCASLFNEDDLFNNYNIRISKLNNRTTFVNSFDVDAAFCNAKSSNNNNNKNNKNNSYNHNEILNDYNSFTSPVINGICCFSSIQFNNTTSNANNFINNNNKDNRQFVRVDLVKSSNSNISSNTNKKETVIDSHLCILQPSW